MLDIKERKAMDARLGKNALTTARSLSSFLKKG
jgi:hypothetical protein